jgi:hypothetical protein
LLGSSPADRSLVNSASARAVAMTSIVVMAWPLRCAGCPTRGFLSLWRG